jgi:hypothetical protein
MSEAGHITVEIAGPGAEPETIDAPATLELVAAYLALLQRIAKQHERPLQLIGLAIEHKCAALKVSVDDIVAATDAADEASPMILGTALTPRGLQSAVERVRAAAKRIPEGQSALVLLPDRKHPLTEQGMPGEPATWERTSFRATPLRVGGERPSARFKSRHEPDFTLELTDADEARRLARSLYREVEITARVLRDANGIIERGTLLSYELIRDGDAVEQWRDWYRSVGGDEWDALSDEDIDAELGRD